MVIARPSGMFDREHEWAALERFLQQPGDQPRIGLVYGRRRMGKSFLLRALTNGADGFYHQALEQEARPAILALGGAIAALRGWDPHGEVLYRDWDAAFRALIDAAAGRPIVLDEFPYLIARSPEIPSVIQRLFDEARAGASPPFTLLLAGSALSVMTRLLTGQHPLRGRASLDLLVGPFDFRQNRAYWAITDHDTAFQLDAVLGGAPGHRALLAGEPPRRPSDVGEWLARGVLDPANVLFREAEAILLEDPTLTDRALYASILAAVAGGATTPTAIANALGRPVTATSYPLQVLERARFVVREEDLLLQRRARLRLADPLVRFHAVVTRPDLPRFEDRQSSAAWGDAAPRFRSAVLGPHFETVARTWAFRYARPAALGGPALRVGFTQVNDPTARERFELDVVAEGIDGSGRRRILAIGEAKASGRRLGVSDLTRLRRMRALLAARADATGARLLLFGRAGFDRALTSAAAEAGDVELVDLPRLYEDE